MKTNVLLTTNSINRTLFWRGFVLIAVIFASLFGLSTTVRAVCQKGCLENQNTVVARDADGKPYSVRYEAVNAMLLNEFLKEHREVAGTEEASRSADCMPPESERTTRHGTSPSAWRT